MLNTSIKKYKSLIFLKMIIITLLFLLITIKYKIYKLKDHIKIIDENIFQLQANKGTLAIEWSYLTNPERLKKIYLNIEKSKKINFEERKMVSFNQIKNINNLLIYYYSQADLYKKNQSFVKYK